MAKTKIWKRPTSGAVMLESLQYVNGFNIKRRVGAAVRTLRLPQYTVWTPAGLCLEEFRRKASAIRWCRMKHVGVKS